MENCREYAEKQYNVCIMGASLETGNRGVSALAVSIVKNIDEIKQNTNIKFLIGNRKPKTINVKVSGKNIAARVVNYRLSPRSKLKEHLFYILLMAMLQRVIPFQSLKDKIIEPIPWLSAIRNAHFIGDIHGGDSFSDIYGLKKFILGRIPDIIAILMNKDFVLLPQTYGPYNHYIAKKIAGLILNRSASIISRDHEGSYIVETVLKKKTQKEVKFCPDVAFTLDAIMPSNPQIIPPIKKTNEFHTVGINVNGLMYNGGYTKDNMFRLELNYKAFINRLVSKLLEDFDVHILFVPHTFGPLGNVNSDPDAIMDVISNISNLHRDRIHNIQREYDQSELKGIIGSCDFFIGSRMHACIAALSQGIPTIGIAYSRKFIGVFETVDVSNMIIDAREVKMDKAIEECIMLFNNRERIGLELEEKVSRAKNRIKATFKEILK